jgi:hypothetical protein
MCVFVSGFNQQLNGFRYNIRSVIGQKNQIKTTTSNRQTDEGEDDG